MHLIHTSKAGLYRHTYDHILKLLTHVPVPRIGLSGGNTPLPLYDLIEHKQDPFFQTSSFFMVDERYVPRTNTRSNLGTITTHMPSMNVHGWNTALSEHHVHGDYLHLLGQHPLDLCLLGVGTDGHIASLFPHSPALMSKNQLLTTVAPDGEQRLSMSLQYILESTHILILFCGRDKKWIEGEFEHPSKGPLEEPFLFLREHKSLSVVSCGL